MKKRGFVYILTNKSNKVFYVGTTSKLKNRVSQHKEKIVEGFTKKYNLTKLVYYEVHDTMSQAIEREKYIKGKDRQYKIDLIESMNPGYKDLYSELDFND